MTSKQAAYIRKRIDQVVAERQQEIGVEEQKRRAEEQRRLGSKPRLQGDAVTLVRDIRIGLQAARRLNKLLRRRHKLTVEVANFGGSPQVRYFSARPVDPYKHAAERRIKLRRIAEAERQKLMLGDFAKLDPVKHWAQVEKALRSC